ncbi:MAG: phosphoribosylglycinamide formyltransferase [Alphaproteobacteria bacterium RIFOXYD12_FULL_60_8]|nr:MAG: phosphoribosylglycinamide formyltransferase [Alphaproteobacteria bacterium RIFOXYD12_FULL_60_8]
MSTSRVRTAILISGRGSNMLALIKAAQDPAFPAQIVHVLSNVPDAFGLRLAEQAGIATSVINHHEFDNRESFDAALDAALRAAEVEIICLAGFMRLLSPGFVTKWEGKLINVHPSLLPAFKGLHTHERVLEAGVRFTGCTVHFVRPAMDDGPIIAQAAVPVLPEDDPASLSKRVLEQEHRVYPLALKLLAEGRLTITEGAVRIKDAQVSPAALINPLA